MYVGQDVRGKGYESEDRGRKLLRTEFQEKFKEERINDPEIAIGTSRVTINIHECNLSG